MTPVLRTLAQALHIQNIAASPLLEARQMAALCVDSRSSCLARRDAQPAQQQPFCAPSPPVDSAAAAVPLSGIRGRYKLSARRSQLHQQRHSTDSNDGSGVDIEASTVVLACPSRRRSIHQKSMLIIRTAKVIAATSAAGAPAAPGSVMSTVEPRQLRRTISSVSQSLSLPHVGRLHFQ